MAKFYKILTYGCQMNVHESEKLAGILSKLGFVPTQDTGQADCIVFNTCCIRESAESRITGHIGALKKYALNKPGLIVAVCGCMTQQTGVAESLYKKFPFVSIISGTGNIQEFGDMLSEFIKERKHVKNVTENQVHVYEGVPVLRGEGESAYVNIMYGCNNFCSYCIVPYVRGRERSRSADAIINEVRDLVKKGYKQIVLLGQNVNSYGKDLSEKTDFADLLNKLTAIEGDFTLGFMTSHPKDFSDKLIKAIAKNPKISKSIHLPVQSGSTKILAAMNRGYTREQYLELLKRIRAQIPDADLTTDIIVGFPGETDEDYMETENLVREVGFNSAFIFMYSKRKGTAAAGMEEQIPLALKRSRIHRLQDLQKQISKSKHFSKKKVN